MLKENSESQVIETSARVTYYSAGRLLIMGNSAIVKPLLARLSVENELDIALVAQTDIENKKLNAAFPHINIIQVSPPLSINGHLGYFHFSYGPQEETPTTPSSVTFDLILDLQRPPLLRQAVLPFGYYAPAPNRAALDDAIHQLKELRGEFDKPKYFDYNEPICAHSSRHITGCSKCIETCQAEAISSIDFKISVDPYLCQGCGSCATVCPSGAMRYVYPQASQTLRILRDRISAYLDTGGSGPVVLFYQAEWGGKWLSTTRLPAHVIAFPVEEIGSIGMDIWLATLCYGAAHIVLLSQPTAPSHNWIHKELDYALAILSGAGYDEARLHRLTTDDSTNLASQLTTLTSVPTLVRATFNALDDKRSMIQLSVDHLLQQSVQQPNPATLAPAAPFGNIAVDTEKCTLCMACVSVCPEGAITDGVDKPRLYFQESQCVQCGLCDTACPEQAITLNPRYNYDRKQTQRPQLLHEETIFCCVSCGKPFATQKMITKITQRLKAHPMFQGERLRQLQMCEDCRIKSQFDPATKDHGH